MIGIVDYSLGNIQNIKNALEKLGQDFILSSRKEDLMECDAIILPGVGHFGEAMNTIEALGIKEDLIELAETKRMVGICLGMQLLFEYSEEGDAAGLGLLQGRVRKIDTDHTIPHLGWNTLNSGYDALDQRDAYFIHSFMVTRSPHIIATADYGVDVPAVAQYENVIGIQFHPEKSGDAGLEILRKAIKGGFQ
ncbi:imidazole glycerol phosphate synthase subunit HisH [Lacicoccus qingdaonensis]|uniref:Imidazole glycerol phosphate synthase subunit HisH n=1 Tax=Lacicoccus qingdaonensis TaxID=576118 RepID=A0A1G9HGV2_9BACL|nr:imidazole glycerol phosphate synthase subunit HisH [Salinicoccus qingdaonensis]SDL12251.1 imidazole glycerol phosphate synthase subunit hisH [Salinicoccus qingdaonensis]